MSLLSAEGLVVKRGGRAILGGVSARFGPGALVAVIGANGAGKSTLLAALAGLIRLDAGEVSLDGRPVARIPGRELARLRAYLPQNPRAEWPIPVERLVALGLTPQLPAFGGLPAALLPSLDRAIAACDLTAQRDQSVITLSGGELARAMLARALVGEPDVLIADEPMTGLDPRHALDGMARLRGLALAGATVIVSVHDLTLAARFAARILVLHQGRLLAEGAPADILTPAVLRQGFGVEARLRGEGPGVYVDLALPD